MTRVHLMGIGGSGVAALARVFIARGDRVSGCDLKESETTRALAAEGALISIGHDPAHVEGQDLLVYSTALPAGNPELGAARDAGVAAESRAEALSRLIADSDSIAVSGTHGKTTVTHMVGGIFAEAGLDPTVLVGDGASSRVGSSRWLVAETDESNGTLTLHRPRRAIVTNIELDHPDHFASVDEVHDLFARFLAALPADGLAVICAEDERALSLVTPARRVTYAATGSADYVWGSPPLDGLQLAVPGRHNRLNATGAAAMAIECGLAPAVVRSALAAFRGARRRMEPLGSWRGADLFDDYGHHPTEVRANLEAARELGGGRLVVVFQPHRYSRFEVFVDDFAAALAAADLAIVTEIYAAGEDNPDQLSAASLAEKLPSAHFAPGREEIDSLLEEIVRPGDLVLFMGAGDVGSLGRELAGAV